MRVYYLTIYLLLFSKKKKKMLLCSFPIFPLALLDLFRSYIHNAAHFPRSTPRNVFYVYVSNPDFFVL